MGLVGEVEGGRGYAYGEQTMILQDDGFAVAEVGGYAAAFFAVEDDAAELRVDGVVF